jgi:hypothetical protein
VPDANVVGQRGLDAREARFVVGAILSLLASSTGVVAIRISCMPARACSILKAMPGPDQRMVGVSTVSSGRALGSSQRLPKTATARQLNSVTSSDTSVGAYGAPCTKRKCARSTTFSITCCGCTRVFGK